MYDRTLTPPHFIGIAAVDMTIPFLEEQSGSAYAEVLESLVRRSTAVCPTLHLGTCVLQALRLSTGGLDSVCDAASMGVGDDCMTADNSVRASGGEVRPADLHEQGDAEPVGEHRPPGEGVRGARLLHPYVETAARRWTWA